MLSKAKKLSVKPCSTCMAPNVQFTTKGGLFEDRERYKRLVEKLNYLIITRLDIAYSVSVMSQHVLSQSQSLESCREDLMVLEGGSLIWNIV